MSNNILESPIKKLSNFWVPIFYITLMLIGYLSPNEVLLLYLLETLVAGFFHAILMLSISIKQKKIKTGIFITCFFMVHYGIFCLVQFTIMLSVLDILPPNIHNWSLMQTLSSIILQPELKNSMVMLMAIYTIKSIAYFFTNENILNIKLNVFMFKAYPRIFVQQFVALFPFFIFGFVSQKYVAAIVLIILRSMADYIIDLIKNNPDKFIAYMQKHDKSLKDSEEGVNELKKYLQDMGA